MNAAHEAVVNLALLGPSGQTWQVDAVVDTGFSLFLTLRPATVRDLGLAFIGANRVVLADGSEITVEVCPVTVRWNGRARDVVAFVFDNTPLVGMSLLDGHTLYVEVERGGRVLIRAKACVESGGGACGPSQR